MLGKHLGELMAVWGWRIGAPYYIVNIFGSEHPLFRFDISLVINLQNLVGEQPLFGFGQK